MSRRSLLSPPRSTRTRRARTRSPTPVPHHRRDRPPLWQQVGGRLLIPAERSPPAAIATNPAIASGKLPPPSRSEFCHSPGERILYEYDFTDGWQHDPRVERILALEPGRSYPFCIGGRRAVSSEDCGGPWAFLALRQRYSVFGIARRPPFESSS
jgi:hypothetical protein